MSEDKLSSSNKKEESTKEVQEYINDFFTFRNVLLCAFILAIIILIFSFLL